MRSVFLLGIKFGKSNPENVGEPLKFISRGNVEVSAGAYGKEVGPRNKTQTGIKKTGVREVKRGRKEQD